MIRLHVKAFSLAKAGNQPEQYEDAWDHNQERLAIADGASDAFESRLWARSLVEAFKSQPPAFEATSIEGWLSEPIEAWRAQIQWQKLPWYAAEKARRGAYATLLGVTFNWPADQMTDAMRVAAVEWQAMAIGDACLFQVREERVITCFPIEESAEFGTTPALLSTRPSYNQRSLEKLKLCQGECQLGDLFVLATDALAAWFLEQLEAGSSRSSVRRQPWQELIGLTAAAKEDGFARLIERLRQEKAIRNDDVTLLLAWVEKEEEQKSIPVEQTVENGG